MLGSILGSPHFGKLPFLVAGELALALQMGRTGDQQDLGESIWAEP